MNKTEWKNYKKNNLKHVWASATNRWIYQLFPDKLFAFFKNFKSGERLCYQYHKLRFFLTGKPILPTSIEYVVTTRCTMNCKHCNTYIPLFTNETHVKFAKFEEFKKDIDTILKAVDYIYALGFVGGEPMLNKDLAKMIEYALTKKQIRHVFLATNCTILPDEELIRVMKNKKFAVQISDYRDVKGLKEGVTVKYDEYKQILKDNGIHMSTDQENNDKLTFHSAPELYKDRQDEAKVQKLYNKCFGRFCNMIADGLFTQCTQTVYMSRAMELSDGIKNEIINIREEKPSEELTKEFIKFYSKPYSEFCHYCHWDNVIHHLPCGEQVEE